MRERTFKIRWKKLLPARKDGNSWVVGEIAITPTAQGLRIHERRHLGQDPIVTRRIRARSMGMDPENPAR